MKVLVVEDSEGHAALVAAQLADAAPGEFEVAHAASLTAALDLLLADHHADGLPDVVLLDLGLPEADGLETLGQIRTAALGVPVVVLSGHDDDQLAAAVVGEGAQDYLVKG
ncbi:MAG TPA: response regulator, partial [Solirubrobacteraceae bacterium]|nr:response regulator [Solirubrobacteraceae bacterium]